MGHYLPMSTRIRAPRYRNGRWTLLEWAGLIVVVIMKDAEEFAGLYRASCVIGRQCSTRRRAVKTDGGMYVVLFGLSAVEADPGGLLAMLGLGVKR